MQEADRATQLVFYSREATRIDDDREWPMGNVIAWCTNNYGIYRQPPRTAGR
jgi:hypothetical protein